MFLPICIALAVSGATVEVSPQVGPIVRGELVSLTETQLLVRAVEGERTLDARTLRAVKFVGERPQAPPSPIHVLLADGTSLRATRFLVQPEGATLTTPAFQTTAPVRTLRWVLLKPLGDAELRGQWEALLAREAPGDRIIFPRARTEPPVLDQLEGTLLRVGETDITFKLDDQEVSPKRERLIGIAMFQPPNRSTPEPACRATLADGSVLQLAAVKLAGGSLAVTTPGGMKADIPVDQVVGLDFASGNLVFLSDLEPAETTYEPFFGVTLDAERDKYLPQRDRDFDHAPLRLGDGRAFEKGLAVRSGSKLVYRLTQPFKRLQATVGLAPSVVGADISPHMVLVVSGDEGELWRRIITGKDEPFELDLEVAGVRRLTIELQYGEGQDVSDFLHLCEARLLK